ncbi:MAG: hypothetical protein RL701_3742, partial [Pseudomonadota bacterium]
MEEQNAPVLVDGGVLLGEIYRDLLLWSKGLPIWQQELLRRVLGGGGLNDAHIDILAEAAIGESEKQPSPYEPLAPTDLPSVATLEKQYTLLAIQDLQNVNALRSDQKLTFGRQLTVVYGDNGAGKSGYARVLKRVYRSRVVDEVLADVHAETPTLDGPSATFTVSAPDGVQHAVGWKDGFPALNIGRFAVLDGACSRTYVRGGALAVGPAGIEIPALFADALERVRGNLASRAASVSPNKKPIQQFENDTEVGRFVKTLSSTTSDLAIAAAATWTAQHQAELDATELALAEAKAQEPKARRTRMEVRLKALESFDARVATWVHTVSQDAIADLQRALAAVDEAEKALQIFETLGSDVPLERLAGDVWTELLSAAMKYTESQHSTVKGPFSIDSRCVLCWQPLDAAATQ